MPLHPQSRSWLAALPTTPPPDLTALRDGMRSQSTAHAGPEPQVAVVRDPEVDGVRVRVYAAGPGPASTVLALHGGGWAAGDLDTHDVVYRRLAVESGWTVVSVDYRRPPEHVFPAALDDTMAVVAGLRAGTLAEVDPERLVVLGDSAGGALAAAAARRLRDAGDPQFLLQVLIYPVTDTVTDTSTYREFTVGHGLTQAAMAMYLDLYGVTGSADPDAAPLRTPDLAGLPPAYVLTAEFDPLREEGEAYAAALAEAGVPVVARRCLGALHGFWRLPGYFDAGATAVSEVAGVLRALA